jgi:hypothetical protein
MDAKLEQLRQKIERESRFTRSLVVICTAAILGVSLVPVKILVADLPILLWNEFDGKLDVTHNHWRILERASNAQPGAAATGAATGGGAAEGK